jgi:hypothetical protein
MRMSITSTCTYKVDLTRRTHAAYAHTHAHILYQAANRPIGGPPPGVPALQAQPGQRVAWLADEHLRCIGEFLANGTYTELGLIHAYIAQQVAANNVVFNFTRI